MTVIIDRLRCVVFVFSFVLVGCGIDSAFDSREAFVAWAIALIMLIASIVSIIRE